MGRRVRGQRVVLAAILLVISLLTGKVSSCSSSSQLFRGRAQPNTEYEEGSVRTGGRALLEGDDAEYSPDIEKLLNRRKCLGLTPAWSPFKNTKESRRRLQTKVQNVTIEQQSSWGNVEAALETDSSEAVRSGRTLLRSRHGYHIPRRWQRPLTGRCRDEGKVRKNISPQEKGLVDCLLSDKEKCPSVQEDAALKALHNTESIKSLMLYQIPCITINKKLRRCATTAGNPETMRMGTVSSSKYSEKDVESNYTSCALIGNGPGLFKQNKADIIDKHDAIFRFNSLHNVAFQGKKTTFRLLNNKRVEGITKKRVVIKAFTPGEAWIIWHYYSLKKYSELKKINDNSRIMAPDYLKFELRAYFGIRKELKRFGNSMRCPMNLNSGMHGILMAVKMCDEINLFGFSYQKHTVNNSQRNTRSKRFQSTVVSPRLSKHHDWHTDALVVKYLAMAGILNIC